MVSRDHHFRKVPIADFLGTHQLTQSCEGFYPTLLKKGKHGFLKIRENLAGGDQEVRHSAALSDRNNRRRLHGGFRCPEWRCAPCRFE